MDAAEALNRAGGPQKVDPEALRAFHLTGALARAGGPQKVGEELRKFQEDLTLLASLWDKLLEEHPGRWVAVFDKAVVAIEDNPEKLLETLRSKGVVSKGIITSMGIPVARTVIEHLTPKDVVVVV